MGRDAGPARVWLPHLNTRPAIGADAELLHSMLETLRASEGVRGFKVGSSGEHLCFRKLLVEWIIDVCADFKLSMGTAALAVTYTDNVLMLVSVPPTSLQLVAMACILVAGEPPALFLRARVAFGTARGPGPPGGNSSSIKQQPTAEGRYRLGPPGRCHGVDRAALDHRIRYRSQVRGAGDPGAASGQTAADSELYLLAGPPETDGGACRACPDPMASNRTGAACRFRPRLTRVSWRSLDRWRSSASSSGPCLGRPRCTLSRASSCYPVAEFWRPTASLAQGETDVVGPGGARASHVAGQRPSLRCFRLVCPLSAASTPRGLSAAPSCQI